MNNLAEISLENVIDEAIHRMISADHFSAGSVISMPLLYPSGACVTLEISLQGGSLLISDRGGASQEADLMGATRYFKKEAIRVAEASGIRFDGRDMFIAKVPIGSAAGAMMVVAGCSQDAASHAALKMSEKSANDSKEVLFTRLTSVFGVKDVAKDAAVRGASNHEWQVSVIVTGHSRLGLFEPVSNNYISIVGTSAKFNDFALLETAPQRISVIKSRQDVGDFYGVIAAASTKIIESSAGNEEFLRLVS